jgi:hypothetical protein
VGPDPARQTIIQPSVDDNVLETLMARDAESADLEAVPASFRWNSRQNRCLEDSEGRSCRESRTAAIEERQQRLYRTARSRTGGESGIATAVAQAQWHPV